MVKPLMSYILRDYVRSFKYIMPLLFFVCAMGVLYAFRPLTVIDSYALSSVVIYITAVWLTLGFIDIEDNTQQQLTILHARNQSVYYLCKVVFIWILVVIISAVAVVYPILIKSFNRSVTGFDIFISFSSHIVLGLLGVSIAVLFNSRMIRDRRLGLLWLVAIILITIVQGAIIERLPFLKFVILLLPPVYYVTDKMNEIAGNATSFANTWSLLLILTAVLVYSLLLISVFVKLMKKKAF